MAFMMLSDEIILNGQRAIARSYAKINLTLDILGKREDGYHLLETIMQTINLSDIIIVDKCEQGIKVSTNKKFLPVNNKNIAYKACEEFFLATKINGGAKIFIHKNIPVAAGLAGGSGNAAAVLLAMNKLYSNPLTDEELCEIGVKIGADVPYCMIGKTQLAKGIGEILTPLTPMKKCYVLLVTPPISVSTAKIYTDYDSVEKTIFPNTKAMCEAIENNDYYSICKNLSNTLESVTINQHPVIGGIKEKMIKDGATGAIMSGSGPTVFGFFDDFKTAKAAHDNFEKMYKDTYLTTII